MTDRQAQGVPVHQELQQLSSAMKQAREGGDEAKLVHLWRTEQQLQEKKLLEEEEQLVNKQRKQRNQLLEQEEQLLKAQKQVLLQRTQLADKQLELVHAQQGTPLLTFLALTTSDKWGERCAPWLEPPHTQHNHDMSAAICSAAHMQYSLGTKPHAQACLVNCVASRECRSSYCTFRCASAQLWG